MRSDSIQPVYGKDVYTTPLRNSLSSVNELHTEAKTLSRNRHGVSTRHLQGYIDRIVFHKHLKYRYEMQKRKNEAYAETMKEHISFICNKIRQIIAEDLCNLIIYNIFYNKK